MSDDHIDVYNGEEDEDVDDEEIEEESAGEKLETSIDFSVEGDNNANNGAEATLEFNRDALLNTTDNDIFTSFIDNDTNNMEEPVPRRSSQAQNGGLGADNATEATEGVDNESINLDASADFSISMDATELLDRTADTDTSDNVNTYNDNTDILSASFDSTNGYLMGSPQHP